MDMGVEEDMRERGKGGEKRKKNGRGVDGVLEKADSLNTESEPVLQEYDGKEKNKEKRDITMQEEGGEEEGEEEQIMVNLKKEGTGDDEDKNKEEDGEREGKEEVVEVEVEVEVDEECEEIGSDKDGWESEKEEEFVGGSRMSYKRLDDMFGRSNRQELKQALHKRAVVNVNGGELDRIDGSGDRDSRNAVVYSTEHDGGGRDIIGVARDSEHDRGTTGNGGVFNTAGGSTSVVWAAAADAGYRCSGSGTNNTGGA